MVYWRCRTYSRVYGQGRNGGNNINNKRRELLRNATGFLARASGIVSAALDAEEDAIGNMPENLESSERYEKMSTAAELLEDALTNIDTATDAINEAMG